MRILPSFRPFSLSLLLALVGTALSATAQPAQAPEVSSQNSPQPLPVKGEKLANQEQSSAAEPGSRHNQRGQRIVVQDRGARIDELRVGGQTHSITVQPKGDMPAYEVRSLDGARARPSSLHDADTTGRSRVWNLGRF